MQLFEEITNVVLSSWTPKCNNEMERRVRLNFEVPLSGESVASLPDALRRLAEAIAKLDDGLTEGTLSTEYQQSLEFYEEGIAEPVLQIENAQLMGLQIYRPTPKEGPSDDLFLVFSTTVRAEGQYGDKIVTWAMRHLRTQVRLKTFNPQLQLPLEQTVAA